MNIFVLSGNPETAAQYQCDKHVVEMVLETALMLSTAHRVMGNDNPILYRKTHENHPCTIWARKTKYNYLWLYDHFLALGQEYEKRYGRKHLSIQKLANVLAEPAYKRNDLLTPFALVMPDEFKQIGYPVKSYRDYYRSKQSAFNMTWKTARPRWFDKQDMTDEDKIADAVECRFEVDEGWSLL